MRPPVSLIDYGVGNLGSVKNMFKRLGIETETVSAPEALLGANRALLPGVGAFDHGMALLDGGGWTSAIRDFVATGRPFLGICLGMQLLLEASQEGERPGLGIIPGKALKFDTATGIRVPHMGWNHATAPAPHALFENQPSDSRFYFVHSYFAKPVHDESILALTDYGQSFASAIHRGNVMGTQFHPEKSHKFGMQLLNNFGEL